MSGCCWISHAGPSSHLSAGQLYQQMEVRNHSVKVLKKDENRNGKFGFNDTQFFSILLFILKHGISYLKMNVFSLSYLPSISYLTLLMEHESLVNECKLISPEKNPRYTWLLLSYTALFKTSLLGNISFPFSINYTFSMYFSLRKLFNEFQILVSAFTMVIHGFANLNSGSILMTPS